MAIMENSFYDFLQSQNYPSSEIDRLLLDKRARDFLFCKYIISDYSEIDKLIVNALHRLSQLKEEIYA